MPRKQYKAFVAVDIRCLCAAAPGTGREKDSLRCLRKLYQATRACIERGIILLVEQVQDRPLQEEQLTVE